jgi:hypothetical protein
VITIASAAKTTTVLATAIATARAPSPPRVTLPRIFERRFSSSGVLLQHGRARSLAEPLLLQGGERAVGLQRRERIVDAFDERVPFANTMPKCSGVPCVGNWPTISLPGTCAAVT